MHTVLFGKLETICISCILFFVNILNFTLHVDCCLYDAISNASPSTLFADGNDETDSCLFRPISQRRTPDHTSPSPLSAQAIKKRRMMSANSEDMISLIICKQLTSLGGRSEWQELYRELMGSRYKPEVIESKCWPE